MPSCLATRRITVPIQIPPRSAFRQLASYSVHISKLWNPHDLIPTQHCPRKSQRCAISIVATLRLVQPDPPGLKWFCTSSLNQHAAENGGGQPNQETHLLAKNEQHAEDANGKELVTPRIRYFKVSQKHWRFRRIAIDDSEESPPRAASGYAPTLLKPRKVVSRSARFHQNKELDTEESEWDSLTPEGHASHHGTPTSTTTSDSQRKSKVGVTFSRSGLLELRDMALASKKLHTVLFLSAASTNLHPTDFYRLNPPGTHLPMLRSLGGLLKVVPGSNPETLSRMPYWILLFSSPLEAYNYQTRFLESYEIATKYYAESNNSALNSRSTNEKDSYAQRAKEFTLLFPSLSFTSPDSDHPSNNYHLTAHLPPFPLYIDYPLARHAELTAPDFRNRRSFPLRISTHPLHFNFSLTASALQAFIADDGKRRGLDWDVFPKVEAVVEVEERVKRALRSEGGWKANWAVGYHHTGMRFGRHHHHSKSKNRTTAAAGGNEGADDDDGANGNGNDDDEGDAEAALGEAGWILRCRSEEEALRFKRAWDRRVLTPREYNAENRLTWPNPAPEVRVETLW